MYCFCGMVDRRKTLSFFSSQDHCQKFLTYPNLWHAASRFCTWAEPKLKFWWIKLYSSNNYCTRWPHRVFWAAINIKRAHSCNILILVSTLLLSNIHTYGLYVRYGIMKGKTKFWQFFCQNFYFSTIFIRIWPELHTFS